MSRDEDALRWEGDDDLDRLAEPAVRPEPEPRRQHEASTTRRRDPLRWLMLALAVAAAGGWIAILVANPVQQPSLLGLAMYQLGELLAAIAPLLWWWLVDRLAPQRRRAPMWILGLVVTAPWPLVAGVVA